MSKSTYHSKFFPALNDDELDALLQNQFRLHCMQMTLEQKISQGRVFTGPGIIKQNTNGKLEFTIYAKEVIPADEALREIIGVDRPKAGQIIPDDMLYQLSATDAHGREWKSIQIQPQKHFMENGTLCTGELQEIVFTTDPSLSLNHEYLHLEICADIRIPFNTSTTVTREIGKQKLISDSLNALKFDTESCEYTLLKNPHSLRVEVKSKALPFPNYFETRLIETLQFVTAKPIYWTVMEKQTAKHWEIRLRTTYKDEFQSGIGPPISANIDSFQCFCNIFGKYIDFVIAGQADDALHPISAQMRAICFASKGSVESEALAISIAVESILKYVSASINELSPIEKAWVDKAKLYFQTWGGPMTLSKRIKGLLTMLYSPSTSTRLDELVKKGAVADYQKEAWSRLRNKVAHGGTLGSASLQEFIDLTNTVLVLFYHLVFCAIGYQGNYIDYSVADWPTNTYLANLLTTSDEDPYDDVQES